MSFSPIRIATETDTEALAARWQAFCARIAPAESLWAYGVDPDVVGSIESHDRDGFSNACLMRRWQRIAHRALKVSGTVSFAQPLGIAYGYVGVRLG